MPTTSKDATGSSSNSCHTEDQIEARLITLRYANKAARLVAREQIQK